MNLNLLSTHFIFFSSSLPLPSIANAFKIKRIKEERETERAIYHIEAARASEEREKEKPNQRTLRSVRRIRTNGRRPRKIKN